jgi:hypothetical protein
MGMQKIPCTSGPVARLCPQSFRQTFQELISFQTIAVIADAHHSGRGAPPTLPTPELIMSNVYHELCDSGTLAEHTRELTGTALQDPSLAERRQNLDPAVFRQVMDATLRPLADPAQHPEAFYHGLRLLGIDGCEFSIANTPTAKRQCHKARSRCGRAAFAKIGLCVVGELVVHNPIAATIGAHQQSEMELARPLLPRLPADSLSLGDRYYGVGKCIAEIIPDYQRQQRHFLFRVRANLKVRRLKRLRDGSRLVEIVTADGQRLTVREIRGRVGGRHGGWKSVRLWTSLLSPVLDPALELLALYGQRWEQEIATDELKNKLHRGHLLKSHTPHTAAQELAALLIAQAVVARQRLAVAARAGLPPLRVSFAKTLRHVQSFWQIVALGEGLLSAEQVRALGHRVLDSVADQCSGARRARSCPRALRQPVSRWPRLRKNRYGRGPFRYQVTGAK